MPSPLDLFSQLPHASFDFRPFPVTKVVVKGSLRHHVHEYPKSPGGAPEKLGRKLYQVTMHAVFDKALLPPWNRNGEDLWPGVLSELFDIFDEGVTSTLSIPTVGNIQAVCVNWSREMSVKARRSGEECELEFLEDESSAYLISNLINVRVGDLSQKGDLLGSIVSFNPVVQTILVPRGPTIFDQILGAIATALGFLNAIESVSALALLAVSAVVDAFQRLDDIYSALLFDDAANAALLEATLEAWAAAKRLQDDLLQREAVPLIQYQTPRIMTVGDVAADLYGDTTRAAEVMQLNALTDPLRIPTGTSLIVYSPIASDQA